MIQKLSAPRENLVAFTGLVVTYNEARRLCECLESLKFCEQLLVIDLGSQDASVVIAKEYGAEVIKHTWVSVVEQVWADVIPLARNAWIIRADPDEILPYRLVEDIIETIVANPMTAIVKIPHQYYFLGKPLYTTRWGKMKYVPKVFHKDRVILKSHVHRGIECLVGYEQITIEAVAANAVQHYWVDSLSQLYRKHWRYIKKEGEARYQQGERFWWGRCIKESYNALKQNLIDYGGLRGGATGIFLSVFYAWYVGMSLLSLRAYQKHVEDELSNPE